MCPVMIIADTAERIKQRAHELFMQFGLRSVSMDDIANRIGISKKTIYQFYTDKNELVDAVVNEIINHNETECEYDRKSSDNAVHEIFLAMGMMMEMMKAMNPSVLYDMQKYHPKAFQRFYKYKNDYLYKVMRENLTRGINEELYRPEIKVDILARFRVESIMLPFHPDFQSKLKYNLAVIQEELILHYLYGLVTQKGYKLILKYQLERQKRTKSDEKS